MRFIEPLCARAFEIFDQPPQRLDRTEVESSVLLQFRLGKEFPLPSIEQVVQRFMQRRERDSVERK